MTSTHADAIAQFSYFLKQHQLRITPQRIKILETFLAVQDHVSMEDLYLKIRETDKFVGQVTVYRTLKLLCEAGFANTVNFEDGTIRYEPVGQHHHDHLVCTVCGKKIEFSNNAIEKLQESVCRKHGFKPTSHHMILYGICKDCR